MNKRALMALVMIVVLTFTTCGAVGLTATKAAASICTYTGPTEGNLDNAGKLVAPLTFSIRYESMDPSRVSDVVWLYAPDGSSQHKSLTWERQAPYYPDTKYPYLSTTSFTLDSFNFRKGSGIYTLSNPLNCPDGSKKIAISSAVGDDTTTGPPPSPPSGFQQVDPAPVTSSPTATLGRGNNSGSDNNPLAPLGDVVTNILSNIPFLSSSDDSNSSAGGTSAGSSSGGLMWLFALGAILLIAAILAFVWWSRREHYEEEDEGYADDEYRRLEERRR